MWVGWTGGVKNGGGGGIWGEAAVDLGFWGAPPVGPAGCCRLAVPALIQIVFGNRLGLGWIELGALVEVVGKGFLGGLVCMPTVGPHGELRLGWAPGRMGQRGRGGLADVGEDLGDGLGLGEERDEREGFPAGGTDQGEDLVDASQKRGPPGGPGGGGIRCGRPCPVWLGSRGRGGRRERKRGAGELSGQGIVRPGPFGDEGSQGSVRGEDAVVAMAVNAGRRKDLGQPVQELESGEAQRGAAGRVWLRQKVENLVGTVADQVEPSEGKRWPCTIPD